MVTPHLPPHQAANALLPHWLGERLRALGHCVRFLSFGPGGAEDDGVVLVRRRASRWRAWRLPQMLEAVDVWRKGGPMVRRADLVHIHSSTWMNQVAARLAARHETPYVLTHYGTEIWHHDGKDERFRRLNAHARHVAFYSQALLDRARELQVPLRAASVVYPAVADAFRPLEPNERTAVRARYGAHDGPLLLNVKRLHPLADHATLLEAMARLRPHHPRALLLIAGTGECERDLKERASALDLNHVVRFLGLVPNDEVARLQGAADLFLLSSRLEAMPTVALEALACGTPVLSTDNPGGVELHGIFNEDVTLVPRGDAEGLAQRATEFLSAPRRTSSRTERTLGAQFRLDHVVERYLSIYTEALEA